MQMHYLFELDKKLKIKIINFSKGIFMKIKKESLNNLIGELEDINYISNTKLSIIYSAEHLIGKHGIHGVTTRDINRMANQKNASSLYYHFGNKDLLIDSILDFRLQALDLEYLSMLSNINKGSNELDADKILDILITPVISKVLSEESWKDYIFFMQQVYLSDDLNVKLDNKMKNTTDFLYKELRNLNGIKDDELWLIRVYDFRNFLISSVAQSKKDLNRNKNKLLTKECYFNYLHKTSKKILID